MKLPGIFDDFLGVIVPRTCLVCGNTLVHGEQHFCFDCNLEMPRTNLHRQPTSRIADRLARLQPSTPLASWFFYRRSTPWSHVVHRAKYGGSPRLARDLGRQFALELMADGFFDDVDCLVPVPIHFVKRLMRGYNQAQCIAQGIADATGLPVDSTLYARRGHVSQTRRSASERSHNVSSNLFDMKQTHSLSGKRVVVVDDVITTGSTIEAVISFLTLKANILQAKVLSLGITEGD